jgi:prolycopene isomerase
LKTRIEKGNSTGHHFYLYEANESGGNSMRYDTIVIGAGLSGLAAASLLAKMGQKVLVVEKHFKPGGSCGIFKRNDVVFDQGSAMFYGFGERGFNPHRFLFNCLEEPIDMIKHDLLYTVVYKGDRIRFYSDVDQFVAELSRVFPGQRENIRRFYNEIRLIYTHVIVENPVFATPDQTDPKAASVQFRKHPGSYLKFFSFMFMNAHSLLKRYFDDPEIFKFFDKLTSTYCYTTVKEAPAVLSAVMFIDNHTGGSYYTAGSTLFLPGKMEKSIEENGGDMLFGHKVARIAIEEKKALGVVLDDGRMIQADSVIYSGTVWNLYGDMIDENVSTKKKRNWAKAIIPTYPSVVLYCQVKKEVIPEGTSPVEMLVGNPDQIDESEVTAYIFSIDDSTLCPADSHTVVAIGPSLRHWPRPEGDFRTQEYERQKEEEKARMIRVLDKRFPGFEQAILYSEISTPTTIERYTMKNGGCVAGPKQNMGQHMFKRLHIQSEWDNVYCCGESTTMGTGTPAVTVSGISAANAILKKKGLPVFAFDKEAKNMVRILPHPVTKEMLRQGIPERDVEIMALSSECQFCESAPCMECTALDIRGILRRAAAGNFFGARKIISSVEYSSTDIEAAESKCVRRTFDKGPVSIGKIISKLIQSD